MIRLSSRVSTSLLVAATLGAATLFAAVPGSGGPSLVIPSGTPAPAGAAPATVVPAPTDTALRAIRPAPTTGPATSTAPSTAPAPTQTVEAPAVTQPFVASITGDKVYVRSGPDTKYYEIGQLTKGDLIYVVGSSKGFYQILPPNGAFCMLDRQYVTADAAGKSGTLTGDYINVHAGSAIYKADPYAILPPALRKGTTVKILGSTEKYYQIAPPEKAYFFISAQFVKATPTEYKVAQLKLPAGVTGPAGTTVEAPMAPPTLAVVTPAPDVLVPTPGPEAVPPTPAGNGGVAGVPLPPLEPKVTFSETATTRFREANARYQDEAKKPLSQQNLDEIAQEFRNILTLENLSPSVKAGSQANLTAIERSIAVQKLVQEQTAANIVAKAQADALKEQFAAADKAIAAARDAGPYSAEGLLQTSTIVSGKYALVNPGTGRVVAYVDPATAQVDIGTLIGKYIGVRGMSKRMEGSDIMVIKVDNATLMPQPKQ